MQHAALWTPIRCPSSTALTCPAAHLPQVDASAGLIVFTCEDRLSAPPPASEDMLPAAAEAPAPSPEV